MSNEKDMSNSLADSILKRQEAGKNHPFLKTFAEANKPQPEKKAEKPKVDKLAKALEGITYTYVPYKGERKQQIPVYLTVENREYLEAFKERTGRPIALIANDILDEHRAFAKAGLIPKELYYSYRTYSAPGRKQLSIAFSEENIAYINDLAEKARLRPTSAFNKALDEYRAVKKPE